MEIDAPLPATEVIPGRASTPFFARPHVSRRKIARGKLGSEKRIGVRGWRFRDIRVKRFRNFQLCVPDVEIGAEAVEYRPLKISPD
jgi:hypothetical protein